MHRNEEDDFKETDTPMIKRNMSIQNKRSEIIEFPL